MSAPAASPNVAQRLVRRLIATRPVAWALSHTIHHIDAAVFRASGGKTTASTILSALPILTVTTTGAKSGQPRAVTLVGIPDRERIILIASNWGQASHPAWYYNVRANPMVEVSGGVTGNNNYTARELAGEERDRAWEKAVALYPGYRGYAARAGGRSIPVILLEEIAASRTHS
jgi:deazaflavin-dependent oxidoreductase (nitroreductase family)